MQKRLVTQMVHSSLRPLRDALDQETLCAAEDELELINACLFLGSCVENLENLNGKIMSRGVEGRKLVFLLKESIDALEESRKIATAVLKKASTPPTFEGKQDRLLGLHEVIERVTATLEKYVSLLKWTDTSAPVPANLDLMTAGNGTSSAGDYEQLDSILSRLESGQEL